jgi:diketogulonate reductase-like aldo/keto reductase
MPSTVTLPDGTQVPALGQGTWRMGERADRRRAEIAALQAGFEMGLTLVDTAEMYGEGRTESLVAEALKGYRRDVFVVSKAYPHHADMRSLQKACEASLKRLGTDALDLYLLHWRGSIPLEETVRGFESLVEAGKIRRWGVSNLDTGDMQELLALAGGGACATNQVLYNLVRRGPEFDLFPFLEEKGISVMAYSPIEQGALPSPPALQAIAGKHGVEPAQIALAWVMRRPGVVAIPKAGTRAHVEQNRRALDVVLDAEDLATLDKAVPPPRRKRPLEMI